MTEREQVAHLLVARAVKDAVAVNEAKAKQAVLAELHTGDRVSAEAGGIRLGQVTKVGGRVTAHIADEKAFIAWVRQRHPTELKTVESINPAFVERLLHQAKAEGVAVDPGTGEVIPGIEVAIGEPFLTVRPTDEASQTIEARLHGLGTGLLEVEQ